MPVSFTSPPIRIVPFELNGAEFDVGVRLRVFGCFDELNMEVPPALKDFVLALLENCLERADISEEIDDFLLFSRLPIDAFLEDEVGEVEWKKLPLAPF
jgi:hypothetical protein